MNSKNLFSIILLFFIDFFYGQSMSNNSLPFENNDITKEKVMAGMFALAVYFIPTIIARDKKKWGYIFIFNLVAAWTIVGWFIAILWAIKAPIKTIENDTFSNF
jgi:hypothetical protein